MFLGFQRFGNISELTFIVNFIVVAIVIVVVIAFYDSLQTGQFFTGIQID
jgi:hypothetical protein